MGSRDSKSPPVRLCCSGADGAVHRLVEAAQGFAEIGRLSAGLAARLAIIVEELAANLIEHGGVGGDGEIELLLAHEADGVRIVLSDSGAAFDLRTAPSEEAIPERGGGAGIDLVRAWTEIVDYHSEPGRNRLELRLPVR